MKRTEAVSIERSGDTRTGVAKSRARGITTTANREKSAPERWATG
jgi:hypothetical protein